MRTIVGISLSKLGNPNCRGDMARGPSPPAMRGFPEADARTRTGDPFITSWDLGVPERSAGFGNVPESALCGSDEFGLIRVEC
jgi:hypothetical protein